MPRLSLCPVRRPLHTAFFALTVLLVGFLGAAGAAHAQGFGVFEQGTCVMGRAGATVAQGCGDGSSIYFNPAHLAGSDGFTASAGATVIAARGEFAYDYASFPPYDGATVELANDPIPVPHLYTTYGLNNRLAVGLGTYVPYGLETVWPTELENGQTFDGAFEGYGNRVQSIYIQPTIAYEVTNRLTVGGGPVLSVSRVELNQFLDLSQQVVRDQNGQPVPDPTKQGQFLTFSRLGVPYHTAFASTSLEGSNALGFGANFGISYAISERTTVGARFLTPITVSFDDGEATFDQINTNLILPRNNPLNPTTPVPLDQVLSGQFSGDGLLTEQTVETEITFPLQLVVGGSVQATSRLLVLADYQFTGWSSFDEIPLQFEKLGDQTREEGYENTHAARLGAEYQITDVVTGRLGYLYNTAAAPDVTVTPLLPEADRNQVTLGLGWHPVEFLEVNVAYQLLLQNDRRGRVQGAPPGTSVTTDLNNGLYRFHANLFATTITLHL